MKTFLKVLLLILILSLLASCSDATSSDTVTNTAESTEAPSGEATENTEIADENAGIGGTQFCRIHHIDFHSTPLNVINYIGRERFDEWCIPNSVPAEVADLNSECLYPNYHIYSLVKYFDISREELEELYFGSIGAYYHSVWNIELIYSGTAEEYAKYFLDRPELTEVATRRGFVRTIKLNIRREYAEQWEAAYGKSIVVPNISIHELAYRFGITEAELRELSQVGSDYIKAGLVYDYDYSAIYNEDGSIKPLDESLSGIEQDALFCGIDDIYLE